MADRDKVVGPYPGLLPAAAIARMEATPVAEAQRLQDDLRRVGIEPYAWVIT